MKFLVVAPAYTDGSGGIVAMHRLCHLLNGVADVSAAITCYSGVGTDCVTNPEWDTPQADAATADSGTVVVYPEGFSADPYGQGRVVRWLLNRPAGRAGWSESDLVVSYNTAIDPTVPVFHLPTVNPWIFYPPGLVSYPDGAPPLPERHAALLWSGKRTGHPNEMMLGDAVEIQRHWPTSKVELADLLRSASVLYSLDPMSAVNLEATLCGTPVLLFPDTVWTRDDLRHAGVGSAGVGWVGDDLEQVRAAAAGVYADYRLVWAHSAGAVEWFVALCRAQWA